MNSNAFGRVFGLFLHYLYSTKRNPARIIEMIVWPGFEMVLFGFLAASEMNGSPETARTTLFLLAGVAYWNCTARLIQESVSQFADDALSKNMQNLLIAPITITEMVTGSIMASIAKLLLSLAVICGVLSIVHPTFFSAFGSYAALWTLQLSLVGVVFSLFAISAVLLLGERVSFIGWFISTALQIFSLVFYNRSALPDPLRSISYFVPSSYVFEDIRSYHQNLPLFTGGFIPAMALLIGYAIIGMACIRFCYRQARQTGTFIKL